MTGDPQALELRPIRPGELESAISLIAGSMAEIPLFEWLLGPHLNDAEARHWLAGFFVARNMELGRVDGAVTDDGNVLAVLVWTAPDNPSPPLPVSVEEETALVLPSRPDIVERLQEMATTTREHEPFADCVDLTLIVTAPSVRSDGIPARLGLRAHRAAVEGGYGVAMMTTSPAIGKAHHRTYGGTLEDTYTLGSVTVYRYRMTPEQVRNWRPATASQ